MMCKETFKWEKSLPQSFERTNESKHALDAQKEVNEKTNILFHFANNGIFCPETWPKFLHTFMIMLATNAISYTHAIRYFVDMSKIPVFEHSFIEINFFPTYSLASTQIEWNFIKLLAHWKVAISTWFYARLKNKQTNHHWNDYEILCIFPVLFIDHTFKIMMFFSLQKETNSQILASVHYYYDDASMSKIFK